MLKIGIVGSGFGVIGLLPAFYLIKGCKVVSVCAKESAPLAAYRKRMGIKHTYTDWRLMLKSEDLDAVAIAVTPIAQYEIAKAAIQKGLHVFAEKPLTANAAQARELLRLAEKMKITHGIDFMFPEIPEWKKTKSLIDNETFGKLRHVSVNWDWLSGNIKNKQTSWKTDLNDGGGALAFYFSLGLNYLEHFAGTISTAKSLFSYTALSKEAESGFDMLLRFKSGATGYAHVSSNSRGRIKHQLIFQFDRAVIVLENENAVVDNFVVRIYREGGVKQLRIKKERNRNNEDERAKIVRKLATKFINACRAGRQTHPSFVEGLRVQELIEQIRNDKI